MIIIKINGEKKIHYISSVHIIRKFNLFEFIVYMIMLNKLFMGVLVSLYNFY